MKEKRRRYSRLFYAAAVLMAVILLVSVAQSLRWINRPFAGFLSYHPPYAGSMSLEGWPGEKAGIRFLERIVSVDGHEVSEGKDVTEYAGDALPGSPLRFAMESKGGSREVVLPVTLFGLRDYILTSVLTVVGGTIIFGLGIVVYVLKPGVPASSVFMFFCLCLGTYMVSSFEILSTYRLVHIHYAALSFMGTALFHLGLLFPEKEAILDRRPGLQYLLYLPSVVLTALYQVYFLAFPGIMAGDVLQWMPSYKTLGILVRVWILACVVGMVTSVVLSYLRSSTVTARQRARIILFGVTFAFLPCAGLQMGYFMFRFDFPWNFLVFFIILFPASVGYAITRHNLFDADVIIKRAVGYAVVTGVVVGAYALVSVIFNMFLGQYQLAQSRAFPIFFTLGVILVFNPLRDRVQAAVDRLFFRAEYDYGAIVEETSRAMTSLLDLGEILRKLTKTFVDDLYLDGGSVMLLGADGREYSVYMSAGAGKEEIEKVTIGRDSSLMKVMEGEKRELTRLDVLEDPRYAEVGERCADDFDALQAGLMVPLVFQDKVIGTLNLGEKKSGGGYKREDVDLLRTIASQGAVAIENARLFQENLEKQRMEEELSIARDLQRSMLPATAPEAPGVRIAAHSTPAKEVGGDFYDFIEMGEGRFGLVVGDVTGKGVSGALVMSASRSIFRMLSEEHDEIGEIMALANRRTKKDVSSGMFVALLYAVVDAGGKTVRLCSAGQVQPVHFSAGTGEVHLVETEGDTFPLGIVDEADYRETLLSLDPGDKVVFYTDGIVEAMNDTDEMFGFDRLLETVSASPDAGASELLRTILEKVERFAGGTAQHDDLTVIVIEAAG